MDHIRTPENPLHDPVKIKYFGTEEYDGTPFLSYITAKGWTWEELIGYEGCKRTKEERDPLIQTWAYFGLMSELLGRKIPVESFTYTDANQKYITSGQLPVITQEWIESVRQQSTEKSAKEMEHAWRCLAEVTKYFSATNALRAGLIARDGPQSDPIFVDELLLLSCEILHQHLFDAVQHAYEPALHPEIARFLDEEKISLPKDNAPGMPLEHSFSSEFLRRRMKKDGWCAAEIERVFGYLLPAERYFVSLLDRFNNSIDHSQCNSGHCVHWKINEKTYETKHTSDNCQCQNITIPNNTLQGILKDNNIPLISTDELSYVDGSKQAVRLAPSGPNVKYVAISHVWADGLGNPKANEIPNCQFDRLSKLVKVAYGSANILFWFDTLCFPLEPKDAYDKALVGMRRTYEEADMVLVLDSYLLNQNHKTITDTEKSLHILCSQWSCRLWTYQESRLAKRISFQFKDGAVELPFGLLDFPPSFNDHISSTKDQYTRLWLRPHAQDRVQHMTINQVRYGISFRATSVASDEALCIANLINIDPKVVVNVEPEERMKALWRNLEPQKSFLALFWNCRRMDEKGFRWAPASLMNRFFESMTMDYSSKIRAVLLDNPIRMLFNIPPPVQLTTEGLSVQLPAVILSDIRRPVETDFFYEENGGWYQVDALVNTKGELISGATFLDLSGTLFPLPEKLVIIFSERPAYGRIEGRPQERAILGSIEPGGEDESDSNAAGHSHLLHRIRLWCTVKVTKVEKPPILDALLPFDKMWDLTYTMELRAGREELIRWNAFPTWGRIKDGKPSPVILVASEEFQMPLGIADPEEVDTITALPPQRVVNATRAPENSVWCID